MKLFKYEGYNITISEEAMLLKPFANIWKRDRSKGKLRALDELGFVYFFTDPGSDYLYLVDKQIRTERIVEDQGLKEGWKPDKMVQGAIDFYESFKTTSALLLESTRLLVDKLTTHMDALEIDERDDRGKPLYALNMVIASIKQANELTLELNKTEKALASEGISTSAMRGQQEKSIFEENLDI